MKYNLYVYYITTSLLFTSENSIAILDNIESNIQHYVYVLTTFASFSTSSDVFK